MTRWMFASLFVVLFAVPAGASQLQYSGVLMDSSGLPINSGSYQFRIYVDDGSGCHLFGRDYNVNPDANGHFTLDISDAGGATMGSFANTLQKALETGANPSCYDNGGNPIGGSATSTRRLQVLIYNNSIPDWESVDSQFLTPYYEAVNAQKLAGLSPTVSNANKLYGVNNSGTGNEFKEIVGLGAISVSTATPGQIQISSSASGTVTSVGLSAPSIFNVGSPVTTSGNLSFTLANQNPNMVWAGPAAGGAAAPSFRALVEADLPPLSADKIASGTLAYSRLGVLDAALVGAGTLDTARLGNIPASVIDGTISASQIPVIPPSKGGTGLTATPTNGQILMGNGSGYTLGTLNIGTGLIQSLGAGSITLSANANTAKSANTLVMRDAAGNTDQAQATADSLRLRNGTDFVSLFSPPSANYSLTLPANTGANGQVLSTDGSGNLSWINMTSGGSGTVTSVGLSAPGIFTVGGSPVTASGNLSLTLNNQSANTVWAGPTAGSAAPSFRVLEASDIPSLDGAKITSGTLNTSVLGLIPMNRLDGTLGTSQMGVIGIDHGGTGLTTAPADGEILIGGNGQWNVSSLNSGAHIFQTISAGSITLSVLGEITAQPNSLVERDALGNTDQVRASMDVLRLKNSSNFVDLSSPMTANYSLVLPPTAGSNGQVLTTDGAGQLSWSNMSSGAGSVNLVEMVMPGIFDVAGGPITDQGTFAVSLRDQSGNTFLAAPDGSTGTPSFRVLTENDLPSFDAAKVASGTINTAQLGMIPANRVDGAIPVSQLNGVVDVVNGGTGLDGSAAGNGRLLIGNGSGYSLGTLNIGNGLSQTLSAGGISLTTNATSANTFEAIVSRDASGNFSAGSVDVSSVSLRGATTGVLSMNAPAGFSNYSLTWPTSAGANGQVLSTDGAGNLSWVSGATGSVTNVGLVGNPIFDIAGGPIVNSGTFNLDLASQNSNLILASPDGTTGTPSFRPLTATDIPVLPPSKISGGTFATSLLGQIPASSVDGTFSQWSDVGGGISYSSGNVGINRVNPASELDVNGTLRVNQICDENGANCKTVSGGWGSGGTVTHVELAGDPIFAIGGSPVTSNGTINIGFSPAPQNYVFAGPTSISGAPTFRPLTAPDIPGLDASKIVSGTLDVGHGGTGVNTSPADGQLLIGNGSGYTVANLSVSNGLSQSVSPGGISLFTNGTTSNTANTLVMRDASGGTDQGQATVDSVRFRNGGNFVTLSSASGASYSMTLPSSTGSAGQVLSTDGAGNLSWINSGGGTVTSVGLDMPAIFDVFNSPVTGAGNIQVGLKNQPANRFLASPNGISGTPDFRALEMNDIPALDATKITSGVLDYSVLPIMNYSKGGTGLSTAPANGQILVGNGSGYTLGTLDVSNGITQSFGSGKIGLSTNATPLNTPNYLVVRDGLGNFSAGSIDLSSIVVKGSTTGTVTLMAPFSFSSYTLQLPNGPGTSGQVLSTNGSGILSWANALVEGTNLLAGDGAASAPSFSFVANPSTGLYRPGTNALGVSVAGAEKMRVTTAGVGIGTTSPSAPLHVNGAGRMNSLILGTSGVLTLQGPSSGSYTLTFPNSLGSNGQVLTTDGTGNLSWTTVSGGGGGGGTLMADDGSQTVPSITFSSNQNTGLYRPTTNQLGITAGGAEVVRITSSQQVGIGTQAPRATLDVDGAIVSAPAQNTGGPSFDFITTNIHYTTNSCSSFTFHNIKDGGSYTFIVQGTSSATCSFTAWGMNGTEPLTVHMPPNHGPTLAGTHTIYNMIRAGSHVYMSWTPGY